MLVLHKLHGLGNDFLVFDARQAGAVAFLADAEHQARAVCERHCGVGADGVIAVEPSNTDEADYQMTLWNADGSRAEMSGNGLRCVAAYIRRILGWEKDSLRVMTDVGVRTVAFLNSSGLETRCAIQMGSPVLTAEAIPFQMAAGLPSPLVDVALQVDAETVRATVVSIGNPHCTVFVDDARTAPAARLGPQLERHPAFPNRTNVEFAAVRDRRNLDVAFWERGVGHTTASGTGACAAAVAAMLKGLVDRAVTVHTAQGALEVAWDAVTDEVTLTGNACYIARVEWAGVGM
ncbi:MAG: diaminopimelate epimerase [Chloracidobacterium sp.]|nr:diaminopimelate epimerase [Chloracidobacterium sp.]MDW8217490.1 diaminopimelate epimerase [Acidobacteriota bacterium]